jgi:threonine 3-dehydrogenase
MIPATMRAAHFAGGAAITLIDKPVPVPGPGQLLLAVGANALCGSERGQFLRGAPVTPGHEAAGAVVAAGLGTHTAVGTRGGVFLMVFCGECRSCRQGLTNQCLDKRGDMGFNRDGGYAQYELIDESVFFPVPDPFSATDATLLLDIMGTGGHAIARGQRVHSDITSLLVTGAGPIGLGVLAMAKLILGASVPVYVTDVAPYRLALAERLGGLPVSVADGTLADGLRRHGVSAVDLAIDTSGKGAARQAALERLDKRGVFVCVGHGEGLTLEVSKDLIAPEHAVLGSEYFRFDELPANLALLREHRAYLKQIITHRFPLADIQPAFELFFKGETGKVVIES